MEIKIWGFENLFCSLFANIACLIWVGIILVYIYFFEYFVFPLFSKGFVLLWTSELITVLKTNRSLLLFRQRSFLDWDLWSVSVILAKLRRLSEGLPRLIFLVFNGGIDVVVVFVGRRSVLWFFLGSHNFCLFSVVLKDRFSAFLSIFILKFDLIDTAEYISLIQGSPLVQFCCRDRMDLMIILTKLKWSFISLRWSFISLILGVVELSGWLFLYLLADSIH